jgi:hypothetical protein
MAVIFPHHPTDARRSEAGLTGSPLLKCVDAGQPGLDRGVPVGGVVIEHDMQLGAWRGASDQLEEAQELR